MTTAPGRAVLARLRHVLPWFVALWALMTGLGLLLTRVLERRWPVAAEKEVSTDLEGQRTGAMDAATWVMSELGDTATILVLLLVVMVVCRHVFCRWHEAMFVLLATWGQSVVFLLVQLAVSRQRPAVEQLDVSPPTSSFPSGHTSAAVALYGSTAAVLLWRTRRRWLPVLAAVLLALPPLVAYSRLYRGMHHPTDVLSSTVNGVWCVAVSWKAFLGEECGLAARLDPLTDRFWRRSAAEPALRSDGTA